MESGRWVGGSVVGGSVVGGFNKTRSEMRFSGKIATLAFAESVGIAPQ